jgi:mannobiose 2-epimerase
MLPALHHLHRQARVELTGNILPFWANRMVDLQHGGFYGRMSGRGQLDVMAEKGGILNARILWTFSAAYTALQHESYLTTARYAHGYILKKFFDAEFGGTYWKIGYNGLPTDTKKQIYSQAFFTYALAAYYQASGDISGLNQAVMLYKLIEEKSFDHDKNGYMEAYSRDWNLLDDMRLSEKDDNEKKTTNTHLHILEAYTCLFQVWKDKDLAASLRNLLQIFLDKIIDQETKHLRLFFDESWNSKSMLVSYGHDIEAAWLLYEAARVLGDPGLLAAVRDACIALSIAAVEGLQEDGSIAYEKDENGRMDLDRHWWTQAETVVGLMNTYELTGDRLYFTKAFLCWNYIMENLTDPARGEWYWSIKANGTANMNDDKAGFWKCPYHNARACMEIMKRCERIIKSW